MVKSFASKATEKIFNREVPKGFPTDIAAIAKRKLDTLDTVTKLDFLRVPPANHLESLKGSRKGQYSIRINRQWHICFVWKDGNAYDVEIVDYHRG